MSKILILEDEEDLALLLRYNLVNNGYDVVVVNEGKKVIPTILNENPDLVVLDWMVPDISGIDVCKMIRQNYSIKNLPLLMLTARGTERDKLTSFSAGIDDYMTKPFSIPEFLARINALLRRTPQQKEEIISYRDLILDLKTHILLKKEQEIYLGPTEFKLLHCFFKYPQKALSREFLKKEILGNIHVDNRTIDVYVKRLRQALSSNSDEADTYIKTIRSVGYIIK